VVSLVHHAADQAKINWLETNYLLLRRGPYVIASGLDESVEGATKVLHGRFINLFDSQLRVQTEIHLEPGSRFLLRDLDVTSVAQPEVLQSACKSLVVKRDDKSVSLAVARRAPNPLRLMAKRSRILIIPRKTNCCGFALRIVRKRAHCRCLFSRTKIL